MATPEEHNDQPPSTTPSLQPPTTGADSGVNSRLEARLDKIESLLKTLVAQKTVKEWYTTEELAHILGRAEFTVREWCRQGRIHAQKKGSGRGRFQSWVVPHAELLRIQKEGLLPPGRPA